MSILESEQVKIIHFNCSNGNDGFLIYIKHLNPLPENTRHTGPDIESYSGHDYGTMGSLSNTAIQKWQ